ncbi:MAG: hypothetical protein R3C19_00335 [Planctomycetaceae bacterium]
MKIHLCLMLVVSVTLVGSGCSRWRGMTRRDYAGMHDPFLGSGEALADTTAPGPSTGVVKLGGPAATQTPEKQAIIASYEKRLAERQRAERDATFPGVNPPSAGSLAAAGKNGPSLSDFMSKPANEEGLPKVTASLPSAVEVAKATAPESAAAVDPVDELAEFGKYLEQQAAAGTDTAKKKTAASAANVAAIENDFAEWAAEWEVEPKKTATQASHIDTGAPSRVTQAAREVTRAMEELTPRLPAPKIADDVASPLISPSSPGSFPGSSASSSAFLSGPTGNTAPPLPKPTAPTPSQPAPAATAQPTRPTNPAFENEPNPFAALDAFEPKPAGLIPAPAAAPAPTPAAQPKTIDATFNFDSGWRPSHLTRP